MDSSFKCNVRTESRGFFGHGVCVCFPSEEAARNRKANGPANIAFLRRRAPDLARRDPSKGSLAIKLKRAGWSDAFLLSLLNQLTKV